MTFNFAKIGEFLNSDKGAAVMDGAFNALGNTASFFANKNALEKQESENYKNIQLQNEMDEFNAAKAAALAVSKNTGNQLSISPTSKPLGTVPTDNADTAQMLGTILGSLIPEPKIKNKLGNESQTASANQNNNPVKRYGGRLIPRFNVNK